MLDTNNWAPLLRYLGQLREPDEEGEQDRLIEPLSNQDSNDADATISSTSPVRQVTHAKYGPLPAQTRDAILQQAGSGLGASEVAMRYGVHEGTVRAIWRKPNKRERTRGLHRFTEEDRQRALELRAEGKTFIEIGLELGFERTTVRKHLRES
ncbi:helix-turn-helix domain-containing protein [Actinomyces qiguomingii]|uniref:helix-turn-helix domain-containing protein n=1 Tax=Actinomyces qiguomingii TaxID=2057800 RepID=UPI001E40D85D|nr:helix-turn-helix domain-containing protein [Actinomyces qiguomingii]